MWEKSIPFSVKKFRQGEKISDGMQEYDDVDQAAEKVNEESEDEEEENIIFPTESDEDEE